MSSAQNNLTSGDGRSRRAPRVPVPPRSAGGTDPSSAPASGLTKRNLVEFDAADLFADESPDWQYCVARATFQHRDEDACEFMLHLSSEQDVFDGLLADLEGRGGSQELRALLIEARFFGADSILLYA